MNGRAATVLSGHTNQDTLTEHVMTQHIHTHTCSQTHIHTLTHAHTHTHTQTHIDTHTLTCTYMYTHIHTYTCSHMHTVYTHTQKHTHTRSHAHTHIHRHIHIHTHAHKHTHAHRHMPTIQSNNLVESRKSQHCLFAGELNLLISRSLSTLAVLPSIPKRSTPDSQQERRFFFSDEVP